MFTGAIERDKWYVMGERRNIYWFGSGETKIVLLYDGNIVIYKDVLEIKKPKLEIARECTAEPWSYTFSADVTVSRYWKD